MIPEPTVYDRKDAKEKAEMWAEDRLADPKTVILDLETTGLLSKDSDTEICQIAITDTKGKPLFSMLLKPNKPMSDEVIGIHKIANEQVINQPTFPQVAKMIAFVLKDKHVIAWNMDFDWKLLMHMFKKYQCEVPQIGGASCAMDKYSEWCGEWSKKKEGWKWQKLPNLSGMPAHDAYSDCVSTIKVMEKMAHRYDPSTIDANDITLDF
jgi:DNA polymerase-3 subunit epsilon